MNEVFIVVILSLKATKQQTQEYLIKLQNFNPLTCIKIKIKIKIDSHSWRSHCCEPTGFHPFHLQGHGPTCLGESDHHCSNHLIKNLDPPSTLLSLESFFNNPYVGLYLEALVFDIRLSVRPSTKEIRAIFNWNYTNSFSNLFYRHHHLHHHNHDNHNANLYLVPVLQFLVPLGSLGLETFSSDLDLQFSFVFCLDGYHPVWIIVYLENTLKTPRKGYFSPSTAAARLLACLRALLTFAPRKVHLVPVGDKALCQQG